MSRVRRTRAVASTTVEQIPLIVPDNASEETLRALHQQVLDAIKKKRAPAAVLPPEDRRQLRGLAKRMDLEFSELVSLVEEKRTNPVVAQLQVRDGNPISLYRIDRVAKKATAALLSNGVVAVKGGSYGWSPSVDEWTSITEVSNPESDYKYTMDKAYGEVFIDAWNKLAVFPDQTTAEIILHNAGLRDSPQETLISWFIETVSDRMMSVIPALLENRRITLRDVLVQELDGAPNGQHYHANFEPIKAAVETWCVSRNLIAEDMRTSPMFDVSINEIWAGYAAGQQQANTRAASLRKAVAKALGFKRESWEKVWTKRTKNDRIQVADTGRISINGHFRCVVEAVHVALPEDDQIVRRMLTLATPHRNQINTLANDLKILEAAWPNTPAIWTLIEQAEAEAEASSSVPVEDE